MELESTKITFNSKIIDLAYDFPLCLKFWAQVTFWKSPPLQKKNNYPVDDHFIQQRYADCLTNQLRVALEIWWFSSNPEHRTFHDSKHTKTRHTVVYSINSVLLLLLAITWKQ